MSFPGEKFVPLKSKISPKSPNAKDLINSLHKLPMYGEHFCMHNFGMIPGAYYTLHILKKERRVTHFQGVIRLPKTNIFYISGADHRNDYGQIFIGEINHHIDRAEKENRSKIMIGPVGSNMTLEDAPPQNDFIKHVFKFKEKGFFHAGGMDIEGNILAVPLEHNDGRSRIKFLNVFNPEKPELFPISVDIKRSKSIGKAGVVALTRLKNKRYLCLVWTDSDDLEPRMDFYLSNDTDFNNGFKNSNRYTKHTLTWKEIVNHPKDLIQYQNIQIHQNAKGQIFLFGTDNTAKLAPVQGGVNRAHMLMLQIDENSPNILASIKVSYIHERRFCKEQNPYNFKAGASFYLNHLKELSLYAVAHYRQKERTLISLGEFYRPLEIDKKEVTHIDYSVLEFYENDNFGIDVKKGKLPQQKKRCLKLYGKECCNIDDLKEIRVQAKGDRGFHEKISSIKGVIPKGYTLKLWTRRGQKGKCHPIEGTGFYFEVRDTKDIKMKDNIRSIELV